MTKTADGIALSSSDPRAGIHQDSEMVGNTYDDAHAFLHSVSDF
jgi:hypothetical protein